MKWQDQRTPTRTTERVMLVVVLIALAAVVVGALVLATRADAHFTGGCHADWRACKRHVIKPYRAKLDAISWCESRNRWRIDSTYDGGFQFAPGTWNATGSPVPFAFMATPLEQRYRAVVWARRIGWAWSSTAGWPVCGR